MPHIHRIITSAKNVLLAVACVFFATPSYGQNSAADAKDLLRKNLEAVLASSADAIEVVYAAGMYSHLEYHPAKYIENTIAPVSGRPVEIERPALRHFGTGRFSSSGEISKGKGAAGFTLEIAPGAASVDLLNLPQLTLKGRVTGRWNVAFADANLVAREENVAIREITEIPQASISLASVARSADLRKGRLLVFNLLSQKGKLHIDSIEFAPPAAVSQRKPVRGMWMWDSRPVVEDPAGIVEDLRRRGVNRIYLQIGDDLAPLVPFLRGAAKADISVWALDGAPGYVLRPEPLMRRVGLVRDHLKKYPDAPFAGFQIDIEPHLNRDFRTRFPDYAAAFVQILARLKEELGKETPLSAVIPFWYDTLSFQDRSFAWHIMRSVDEVVVMSYRTSFEEIEAISREELAYGERLGIPVFLAVETTAIPDEQHVVFRRCAKEGANAGSSDWCRVSEYDVPGSRISFATSPEKLPGVLSRRPIGGSFAGWVIHSYETAPR